MRKTIPKNRADDFLKRVIEAKSYTLENNFKGERITDFDHMRAWRQRLDGKVTADDETKRGQIYYHSNHWVEFRFA